MAETVLKAFDLLVPLGPCNDCLPACMQSLQEKENVCVREGKMDRDNVCVLAESEREKTRVSGMCE